MNIHEILISLLMKNRASNFTRFKRLKYLQRLFEQNTFSQYFKQ